MSVTLDQAGELVQHRTRVFDYNRDLLGLLAQVYVEEDTNEPLWVAVVFNQPSTIETVVPIHDADVVDDDLVLNYARKLVESGPHVTAGDELPWVEEERLRDHYGSSTPTVDASDIVPITDID